MPDNEHSNLNLALTLERPEYYILIFPMYGKFAFYGTRQEAYELFYKTQDREKEKGFILLADPENKQHRKIVSDEILAVRADRSAGQDLPYYPARGWI